MSASSVAWAVIQELRQLVIGAGINDLLQLKEQAFIQLLAHPFAVAKMEAYVYKPALATRREEVSVRILNKHNVSRQVWHDGLVSVLCAAEACNHQVSREHIRKDALVEAEYLVLAYVADVKVAKGFTHTLGAFVIANRSYKNYLYLHVVCASDKYAGLGKYVIQQAETLAEKHNLKGTALASLKHVVGYYRKLGYRNRKACRPELSLVEPAFSRLAQPLINKYKNDVSKHIATDEGRDYQRFLQTLVDNKLTLYDCQTVPECNRQGYIMTKCFDDR
jgi:hypothetical protein